MYQLSNCYHALAVWWIINTIRRLLVARSEACGKRSNKCVVLKCHQIDAQFFCSSLRGQICCWNSDRDGRILFTTRPCDILTDIWPRDPSRLSGAHWPPRDALRHDGSMADQQWVTYWLCSVSADTALPSIIARLVIRSFLFIRITLQLWVIYDVVCVTSRTLLRVTR